MAVLRLDGFSHYATADLPMKGWAIDSSGTIAPTIAAGEGRLGNGCIKWVLGSNQYAKAVVVTPRRAAATASGVLGFAIKVENLAGVSPFGATTPQPLFGIVSTDSCHFVVCLNPSGTFSIYRAGFLATTHLLGTTSGAIIDSVYAMVELKWTLGDSGSLALRINNSTVLSGTYDTLAADAGIADTTWQGVMLAGGLHPTFGHLKFRAANGANVTLRLTDFYVYDLEGGNCDDFAGDKVVGAIYPDANGATRDWTPSAGTDDFAVIDEHVPNDDTDYLAATAAASRVTVGLEDTTATDIAAVQLCAMLRKGTSGAAAVKPVLRHAGSDNLGEEVSVASDTDYVYALWPYGVNPGTSSAFTDSDVNALEVGLDKTA